MGWWPRSIRWQMLLGLALLEVLSIGLFASVLIRLQREDIQRRAAHRLTHQADSVAQQVQEALRQGRQDWLELSVHMMGEAPSVARVRVTDSAGRTLAENGEANLGFPLSTEERAQIERVTGTQSRVFTFDTDRWESVKPVYAGSTLYGYVWIESERAWDTEELKGTIRVTAIFAVVWVVSSMLLALILARRVSRPLAILYRGTRDLVSLPETSGSFPLPVTVNNEIGDLISAFNRMVAAIEEQRAGLRDTLSLLDSMLANAPVGFAFFDRYSRFVRVNQVFADLTGLPVSRHLGRTPDELLPTEIATQFNSALQSVFGGEEPVNDLEFHGASSNSPWTWLVSAYPVRTMPQQVRWAGVIIRDVSERVRSEESLRKTEKLAATGRLAASIAHEINNPLEGLTNLLYLLRTFCDLTGPALDYVVMAEHQTRRIAEIAQKTLRFYRQSTLPVRARVAELIDSIVDLYKARMNTLDIQVEQECDPELTLFCYEGEIRQVLANLIGNAVDAMNSAGRLIIRARRSQGWRNTDLAGVRITIADTGAGMSDEVRDRIFEAFFTTKEAVGTGLGLWVSQEIIDKHHGLVRVRSRAAADGRAAGDGRGTGDGRAAGDGRVAGDGRGSGTVFQLFVPDDEMLGARHRLGIRS